MSHGPSKLVLVVLVVIEPPGFKLNTNDLYSNAITFVFSPAITNMEEEIDTVTSSKIQKCWYVYVYAQRMSHMVLVIEPPGFKLSTNPWNFTAIMFVFPPAITNMEEEKCDA